MGKGITRCRQPINWTSAVIVINIALQHLGAESINAIRPKALWKGWLFLLQ